MDFKLYVDGKNITLNKFVEKFLSGTLIGAVTSLKYVKKDWKEIEIKIKK